MDLAEIIKSDQWAVAEGNHNDLPLMIRFRNKLSRQFDISEHPQLIQIFWEFEDGPSGMPSIEESQEMEVFENRLVDALETDLSGVLTGVVTTNGYREWVYYTKSVEVFSEKLHHMPQEKDPYPIEVETDNDPDWNYFFDKIYTE